MGLFRKLGREVGEFTHNAKAVADADADFECRACGARFNRATDGCPECGSDDVVATENASEESAEPAEPVKTTESTDTAESTDTTDETTDVGENKPTDAGESGPTDAEENEPTQ